MATRPHSNSYKVTAYLSEITYLGTTSNDKADSLQQHINYNGIEEQRPGNSKVDAETNGPEPINSTQYHEYRKHRIIRYYSWADRLNSALSATEFNCADSISLNSSTTGIFSFCHQSGHCHQRWINGEISLTMLIQVDLLNPLVNANAEITHCKLDSFFIKCSFG